MRNWDEASARTTNPRGEELALASELDRRERRGLALTLTYLAGLLLGPVMGVALMNALGGPLLGVPAMVGLFLLMTQRTTEYKQGPIRTSIGDGEEALESPVVPVFVMSPSLEAVLEKVAAHVGAPVPSAVFYTPETFAAGWVPDVELDFMSWRIRWVPVLYLGIAPMRSLTRQEFDSILAHELGHLIREPDVTRGLQLLARGLAERLSKRADTNAFQRWMNPACLWTRAWFQTIEYYLVHSERLEEMRADQCAARVCGGVVTAQALEKYLLTMAQISATCEVLRDDPNRLHRRLARFFVEGSQVLPPVESDAVARRLAGLKSQPGVAHPAPSARQFLLRREEELRAELNEKPQEEGCLYLLRDGAGDYLAMLVRYLVQNRFMFARLGEAGDSPWQVCQEARRGLRALENDDLPRWRRGHPNPWNQFPKGSRLANPVAAAQLPAASYPPSE